MKKKKLSTYRIGFSKVSQQIFELIFHFRFVMEKDNRINNNKTSLKNSYFFYYSLNNKEFYFMPLI